MAFEESQTIAQRFGSAVKIIGPDGSERSMTDEDIASLAASFDAINEREKHEDWDAVARELERAVPNLLVRQLGGHVPIQGHGTLNGEEFYFRARGTSVRLGVGCTDPEDPDDISWHPRLRAEFFTNPNNPYAAGWLTPQEVFVYFVELTKNLEEYTFEDAETAIQEYIDGVDELVKQMKATKEQDQ